MEEDNKSQNKFSDIIRNYILVFMFLTVLAGGWVFKILSFEPKITLSGVTDSVFKPELNNKGSNLLLAGEYQAQYEKYFNTIFPLREIYIKLCNTFKWSAFSVSGNNNIIMGNNYNLFYGTSYINDYYIIGDEYNGNKNYNKIEKVAEDLDYIRKKLGERGKEIYVFITPNKVEFFPEDVPHYYKTKSTRGNEGSIRNIDALKECFDKYNIPFFDSTEYFLTTDIDAEVFVKSGIHYTWSSGYCAIETLFKKIRERTNLDLPVFNVNVTPTKENVFPDEDIFEDINTIQGLSGLVYRNQIHYLAEIEFIRKSSLKLFCQGGSFVGPFVSLFYQRHPNAFQTFDYIQNKSYYNHKKGLAQLSSITDIDISEIINNDLFIFEVNEAAAGNMSFGFIQHFRKILETGKYDDSIEFEEYPTAFNPEKGEFESPGMYGFYSTGVETKMFCWTKPEFGYTIKNDEISKTGLQIDYYLPSEYLKYYLKIFELPSIEVIINGKTILSTPLEAGSPIYIPPEMIIPVENNIFNIEIICNSSFTPNKLDPASKDNRLLSLVVKYIGAQD